MQCGIACLAMVCMSYGKRYSLYFLSQMCPFTKEGTSLLGLSKTAEKLGFETVCVRLTLARLQEVVLPCIIHWEQNHFVVLYKIKKDKFYISDPRSGRKKIDTEEFEKKCLCEGNATCLIIEPGQDFGKIHEGQSKDKKLEPAKFMLSCFIRYRRRILIVLLALLCGSLLQLLLPFLTQAIVDSGIKNEDIGFIWLLLLGELMIVLGRTSSDFFRDRMVIKMSMLVNVDLVCSFLMRLFRLPMSFFENRNRGDILQRINDHARIETFLTTQSVGMIVSVSNFIIFGFVLFYYDRLIFLVYLMASLLYCLWVSVFMARRKTLDYDLFRVQSLYSTVNYQLVSSMQEIKLQDCESRRSAEWAGTRKGLFDVQWQSLRLQQIQQTGGVFINEVKNALITVLAAKAVIDSDMTIGGMLAIQYIIGQLNAPLIQLVGSVYQIQDVRIALERIGEVYSAEDEEKTGVLTAFKDSNRSIVLDKVRFRYDYFAIKDTIHDVSMEIPSGKVTAIVGASGCGKTTLVKLMLGYYPVLGGSIRIAGRDISAYSLKWWRRQCGVVMQDGFIFSESIERNIAVDDGEIDRERLESAARIANIHDYIMSLPLKYDTKIGAEGNGLSQGQRQRILIARAVYRNPSFIFLDEATNSLDASNEREIVENLDRFYRGRTVVVVAHRLSTVRNADKIVVMDGGCVVETGTHEELVARRGHYYNLVRNQLELGA